MAYTYFTHFTSLLSFLFLLVNPTTASSELSCPTITRTTSQPYCPILNPTFCVQPDCILESIIEIPCGCPSTVPTSTFFTPCPTACRGACGTAFNIQQLECTTTTTTISAPLPTCDCTPTNSQLHSNTQTCSCPFRSASPASSSAPATSGSPTSTPIPTTPPPSSPITSPLPTNTCFTITKTSGSSCPLNTCPQPECIQLETATIRCGCSSITTTTSCKTTCDGACMTTFETLAIPCPVSTSRVLRREIRIGG